MAKRGRPPKPKAKKAALPEGAPDCPPFIGDRGREEWARVVAELDGLGVLAKVDRGVLAIYCQAWDEFQRLTESIGNKWIVTTTHGNVIQNPAVGTRNSAADRMQKAAVQLGFSPASREKLTDRSGAGKSDGLKEFLRGVSG